MNVEVLTSKDKEKIVSLFCEGFHNYPVMKYSIGNDLNYEGKLRDLIGFYCEIRFSNNWPVLGIFRDGQLLAGMLVSDPTSEITGIENLLDQIRDQIGKDAFERMKKFEEASDQNEPEGNHYFVGMLGVHPDHQKKGYGKNLINYVKKLAILNKRAGVCLSTEDSSNVPYYERMGFEVIGESDIDHLHTWCFYWKTHK